MFSWKEWGVGRINNSCNGFGWLHHLQQCQLVSVLINRSVGSLIVFLTQVHVGSTQGRLLIIYLVIYKPAWGDNQYQANKIWIEASAMSLSHVSVVPRVNWKLDGQNLNDFRLHIFTGDMAQFTCSADTAYSMIWYIYVSNPNWTPDVYCWMLVVIINTFSGAQTVILHTTFSPRFICLDYSANHSSRVHSLRWYFLHNRPAAPAALVSICSQYSS